MAFRAAAQNANNNTNATIALPSTVRVGDLVLVHFSQNNTDAISSAPSVLTLLDTDTTSSTYVHKLYYATVDGTNVFGGMNLSWPLSATRAWELNLYVESNVARSSQIISYTKAGSNVAATTTSTPNITPSANARLIELVAGKSNGVTITTWTAPAGWTARSIAPSFSTFGGSSVFATRDAGDGTSGTTYGNDSYSSDQQFGSVTKYTLALRPGVPMPAVVYRLNSTSHTWKSPGRTDLTPPSSIYSSPDPANFTTLLFQDEFSGSSVDTSKWNVTDGDHHSNEFSMLWARNVTVSGGYLHIQPKLETTTVGSTTRNYTSGYLDTIGKFSPTTLPLYFEYRCQMPMKTGVSAGMWPAFWLRGSTGAGEIDIMEAWELGSGATSGAIAESPHGKYAVHIYSDTGSGAGKAGNYAVSGQDLTQWHTYGCKIAADGSLSMYYDRALVYTFAQSTYTYLSSAFAGGYNIRLNLQIGSTYYGLPDSSVDWTQQYVIDYVRCWGP